MTATRQRLLERIQQYLAETGMGRWQFGMKAVGDNKFVSRIEQGKGVRLDVIDRADEFMRKHPPPANGGKTANDGAQDGAA